MKKLIEKFAVIGKPIFHSLSPEIFTQLYKQHNFQNTRYYRISANSLNESLEFIQKFNFKGFNVTAPYKEQIINSLHSIDKISSEIGAVNTVLNQNNKLFGSNTDFLAIVDLLEKYAIKKTSKILVLGAGGAAKAAINALKSKNYTNVHLSNRTHNKIINLPKKFDYQSIKFNNLKLHLNNFDFIINTTPLQLHTSNKHTIILNADYSSETQQDNIISGKEWLLLQALYSFQIYHKINPDPQFDYKTLTSKKKKIITLIGFSGSGKTTIAKHLSKHLGLTFIDIDLEIEKQTSKSIQQIFNHYGENHFRKIESQILKQILNSEKTIISCGGGIVKNHNNRKLLQKSLVCWLYTDPAKCLERKNFHMNPPLNQFNHDKNLLTIQTEKLFNHRLEQYFATAHNIIINNSDEKTIIERLKNEISKLQ